MSLLDRIAATVTPTASDQDRAEARRRVEELAANEPWVRTIVDQHKQIERRFGEARAAADAHTAAQAVEELATLLTGHANAEEAALYPEVVEYSGKTHGAMAYEEHAMTKVQLAKLRNLNPRSEEWREKLEHVESAVQQHIYQEEDSWLPDLVENLPAERKDLLTRRYQEEFGRYCGNGSMGAQQGLPEGL
ncbi:hemerythrin domain-containing protein [Pelagerythrobacter rhizovicinus]|uniref:Hemerythrin domain-containing protein n=1 Tax=Pelagerythrobacter rhizovicinus TaxID=2268576 RepID=A0A4Q2KLU1_9SPHN|nr:hemerythrin domain-containing protein [Pelagerythrobacter rhizovicinus]RXZ65419.1 hemerythrin domain-containing protein [Pelagerythrobacter rhizovicinus]